MTRARRDRWARHTPAHRSPLRAPLRARRPGTRSRPHAPGQHLARRQDPDREAGATAVELLLLSPVVFLMTFLPIQAGLVLQARHVATAAAQEGARASRVADLNASQAEAAGRDRANGFATTLGGKALRDTNVTVDRGPDQVSVTVTGKALSILPGFKLKVTGRSITPVEQFEAGP